MDFSPSQAHPRGAPLLKLALALVIGLGTIQAALAVSGFLPQRRLGYRTGDQWEPAIAADTRGHLYVLYPQYGNTPVCPSCAIPSMTLVASDDNGASWHSPRSILPFSTGQFDPQIVVDPADHQSVYASWLQNNKRDIVVARSLDFGRTWSFSWAERGREDADKPTLAVRGGDVYVGFNHEERLFVASSHDAGQTFTSVAVNPNAARGSSLAGGATVDPAGNIFFGWTAYARHDMNNSSVSIYVSRSADGGRSWSTQRLDESSAPPGCEVEGCQTGYLGPQISLASDTSGALCALWNAGAVNGGAERIYFASSTTAGATWSARIDVSGAPGGVEHAFPTLTAGASGDVRVAWMDTRRTSPARPPMSLWNTYYRSSTNGGATWGPEVQLSSAVRGYEYILAGGFRFPFGDYFGLAIDSDGATHAVWGEGMDYKSPGSIWYTQGR